MNRLVSGPRQGLRLLTCGLMLLHTMVPLAQVQAEVTGGAPVDGSATIVANVPGLLIVNSNQERAIVNWDTFSTDAGHLSVFGQSSNGAILNRVGNNDHVAASFLNGTIVSPGNVLFVNPNGIVVGPNGLILTKGFTASVLDISDRAFFAGGNLTFSGDSTASVVNQGQILTGRGGAALIGGDVINEGTINSVGGNISLATGGSVTLADGSRFTHADLATIQSGISPYAGVIKNEGTIRATGAFESGGEVYLVNPGGKIMHDGTIAATKRRGIFSPRRPGDVYVSADTVDLGADIDANVHGGSSISESLADPSTVNVYTSDAETQGSIQDAVDMIAESGTVNVARGSYEGATIETDGVTINGSGRLATEVVTGSPAITVAADNVTIQNLALVGTGAPGDIGVLIDGQAAPGVTGTNINNVLFANLEDGIRSRGTIGSLDVNRAFMTRITDDGIDLGIVRGDVNITNSTIGLFGPVGGDGIVFRRGLGFPATANIDSNVVRSTQQAIQIDGVTGNFLSATNVDITDNVLTSTSNNGVDLGTLRFADIEISGNVINADENGIDTGDVTLSSLNIGGNTAIRGEDNGVQTGSILLSEVDIHDNRSIRGGLNGVDLGTSVASQALIQRNLTISGGNAGIRTQGTIGSSLNIADNFVVASGNDAIHLGSIVDSQVGVVGNGNIIGGNHGVVVNGGVTDSFVSVSGNNLIQGLSEDAIRFNRPIRESLVTIGPTLINIDGSPRFFGGNNLIIGGDDGINVDEIQDSIFAVSLNNIIRGIDGSGIEFDDTISDSIVGVLLNNSIRGGEEGIEFDTDINDSLILIARNNRIVGDDSAGIQFKDTIDGGIVSIGGFLPGGGNDLIQGGSNGIEFQGNIEGGATVNINNNDQIVGVDRDGITFDGRIRGSDTSINIRNNDSIFGDSRGVAFSGRIDDASVNIRNNRIEADDVDAVLFNARVDGANISIRGNRLIAGDEGIDIDRVHNSNILIAGNRIRSEGDGIEWEDDLTGSSRIMVANNRITAGGDGIRHENQSSIRGNTRVVYRNNVINVDGGSTGIRIANVDSTVPVRVVGGVINGGAFGLRVDQRTGGLDGHVILNGLTVNGSTNTGLTFTNRRANSTLAIDLINEVTVNGGASANDNGLVFSGPGLSLVGDTLNDLVLLGQNGNYIELRNGALFEPGRPTLIDATGVTFDGLNAAIPAQRQQIVDKIVDFLDDPTLGLIFPGAGLGEEQTYDRFTRYDDYFRTIMTLLTNTDAGTISVPAATITISEELE